MGAMLSVPKSADVPPPAHQAPPVALKSQPTSPAGKVYVIEARGGSDKGADGHRKDTIPICNALIDEGWFCSPIFYSDSERDAVFGVVSASDAFICRINPGAYEGVTQKTLNQMLSELSDLKIAAMSHPEVMRRMGAKDALVKIRNLSCGMPDTYAYYTVEDFKENFPQTIVTGTRVLKQNRGSQGEGIWVCKLLNAEDADNINGGSMLHCTEAKDNHVETHSLDDFMTFCERYIIGDEGQLIDQRFLPRIVEGELRVNMIYDKPTSIVHKKPAPGGISATLQSGAKYVNYEPDDPQYAVLMDMFLNTDLPQIMTCLDMSDQPVPLLWTADFILGDQVDGQDTYFVGEFNCSCVGITTQLHLSPKVALGAIDIIKKTKADAEREPELDEMAEGLF